MVNIISLLSKGLEESKKELIKVDKLTGVDTYLYEIAAEILGHVTNRRINLLTGDYSSKERQYRIKTGDTFSIQSLIDLGYEKMERVWSQGEVSVLGDIVMIWPYSMNNLVRVSILGEKVESIDIVDSLSRKKVKGITDRTFLKRGSNLFIGNESAEKEKTYIVFPAIGDNKSNFNLGMKNIPGLANFSNTKTLLEILKNFKIRGFKILYYTNDVKKVKKLGNNTILEKIDVIIEKNSNIEVPITRGFMFQSAKTILLTDLEVLGQINLADYEQVNKQLDPSSVEILKKIIPGEYVVHKDHGIGKFAGVQQRDNGYYINISYAGEDKLYVPLSASEKITKYIGAGKAKPVLTGLNSGSWKRISKKASERVEEIAKELLGIYALRKISKSPFVLQERENQDNFKIFVEEFPYKDTDDQILATQHILKDLRSGKPMDRLLVGDVGFGKTEIAMRAMFPVVENGFQVVFLAPTTILVQQHLAVLRDRFKNYPYNIQSLSRFSSDREKELVLKGLENGTVDIVVGTHTLLGNDVKFKNLGLLVIDEEQKFGVKQKEKIKGARVDTNVLSLTATPIPRTLNMALIGIRDITVLAIPPQGRKEIYNHFERFNWDSVIEAIREELARGGQIYFLHNRIGTIENVFNKLKELFPNVKISIVHGRMGTKCLASAMTKFVTGQTDILICTTIIENGLDIPNANTLIVDDASRLGLSQMYQIRGRVGRSLEQAHAYFFFDKLGEEAKLRLDALADSQSLGSGFLLSNKDLEIRGAGDILGKNQSGAINSIGYGLYTQMLAESIERLKIKGY
jgi:transcription-repair coupling factor (superfamily II helicase)